MSDIEQTEQTEQTPQAEHSEHAPDPAEVSGATEVTEVTEVTEATQVGEQPSVEPTDAPAQDPSDQTTSAEEAPVVEAPVEETVAAVDPAHETPEQETPEQETPEQETPEQETPAQDSPAADDAAPAEAAAQETPAADDAAPAEAPGDAAPATDATAPVQAPAGETPATQPHVPTPAEVVAHATPAAVPSPAMLARPSAATAALREFGRVGDDGIVFVKTPDGGEREVGSYPGTTPGGALAYFGRKYDELLAAADLLLQRLQQTEVSAKDAEESYAHLREQTLEPHAVGDLAALEARVEQVHALVVARREEETATRAAARDEARTHREALVAEAEKIAAQPPERVQWKSSGARMRELLDEWKQHQRTGPRLDRTSETAMWQRFSAARNSFDRARRVWFAQLDTQQSEAKATKTRLVADAERLSTSKDWAPTAGAFKRLMDEWRRAGRAGRQDDDALWARFRAAQDAFFEAKDAVVAAEEEGYRGNLVVKEQLIVEAEQILPVTDLERAKTALRSIQDRWDKAGKVPRADLERTEKALRRVEQAVRDVEDRKWSSTNPEAAARARSLVTQLEGAVADLRADLEKAQASGNTRKVEQARSALEAREAWLAQARAGVEEFGG